MHPRLRALAARQGGLFTRAQAIDVGYRERELRTLTAVGGPWVVVRRGTYAERELVESMNGYDDRMRLVDRAVHLTASLEHVMSHDSAARARRIPMLRPRLELSHLTREGVKGTRTECGVRHHLSRVELAGVEQIDGMIVTNPARTALDLAREHGLETGVATCDHVLHHGTTTRELSVELLVMTSWPNITRGRQALALADGRAESIGESLMRLVVGELGIGTPDPQFPVRLARGPGFADLRVGRHLFEFDGRLKYLPVDEGGVSDRAAHEIVWAERNREREMLAQGFGVSRVIWDQLFGRARGQLKERLEREYAATLAQHGKELTVELAEYAARVRRAHRRAS